jgi:hypothetical protein
MRFGFAAACCAASIAFSVAVQAATLEELKRYDKDGDGKLDRAEREIFQLHKDDPMLAKYDVNTDGRLDAYEYRNLQNDIAKRYGGGQRPAGKENLSPEELFSRGKGAYEATHGGIPIQDLVELPKKVPDECHPSQNVYVRRDQLDTYLYGITPRSKAKGASVSFTDDRAGDVRTLTVDGVAAYVLARQPCLPRPAGYSIDDAYLSAYAIAPWVEAHGSINDPIKKSEKNSLKFGTNVEFTIFGGGVFNYQAFIFAPYAQMDFRGVARAGGISAAWEPYQIAIRLGGSPTLFSEYLDWYWQLRAEADIKRVERVGYTNLQIGSYGWIGGTARLNVFLFPTWANAPDFLRNRLHATGTFQAYWDVYSQARISSYSAELAYNLTEDGSASVSAGYERGTVKDTLEWVNQYVVKLNYKY